MEWKPGKIFIIEGSIENLLCGRRSVKWGKVPVAAKVGKKVPVARFFFFALWPKSVASRLRNCQSGHLRKLSQWITVTQLYLKKAVLRVRAR